MKDAFFVLALLALTGCSASAEEGRYAGQVIFLLAPEGRSEAHESPEVESDLNYLLENVSPYFEKHRIKYEVKREEPAILIALNGKTLSVRGGELPSVGYVLVKTTGEFVVRVGLGTDVDVIMDVTNFFQIAKEQEARPHKTWLQPSRYGAAFPDASWPALIETALCAEGHRVVAVSRAS